MKRFLLSIIIIAGLPLGEPVGNVTAEAAYEMDLYAESAVLIDGSNNRILYGKNENESQPMASTTKIMTLAVAVEANCEKDIVTFSAYAARQPDVQLNANCGEQYLMSDLMYIMMLRSYNDVAVAIAEHIGAKIIDAPNTPDSVKNRTIEESKECVKAFAAAMNEKAKGLGCVNTYFITPNGLDAEDEQGEHSTTAYELAKIAAYAIDIPMVEKICTTRHYSCDEKNKKRHVDITSTDLFLDMVNGAVGMKTGFTGKAGYCFVGAVKQDGRKFISVVLASGWPPNKNYKWTDTKKLINYGIKNFFQKQVIAEEKNFKKIPVIDGVTDELSVDIWANLNMLLSDDEKVKVKYALPQSLNAPIIKNTQIGKIYVYVGDEIYKVYPILATKNIEKKDFDWHFNKVMDAFFF